MVFLQQQNLKTPKQENETAVIMEEDDVSLDDEVTLNSSITEGAVTRALYGDKEGECCLYLLLWFLV